MSLEERLGALLRAHGLRSTPQRRVILATLEEARGEHLSADEVRARALRSMPSLGRGTVYTTLAELTEIGALSAVGLPEPVRYEANTAPHDHFRCRVCLRLFDLDSVSGRLDDLAAERFEVQRLTAEGVCGDCRDYEFGLRGGVEAIHGDGPLPWSEISDGPRVACARCEGPLGTILLEATPRGLVRLAFEDHVDAPELQLRCAASRGSSEARAHLRLAASGLERYLAGDSEAVQCTVDVDVVGSGLAALSSTSAIRYGGRASYTKLGLVMEPRQIGLWMGANPLPIVFPCHRVTRGTEIPEIFVGGLERRRWLEAHERRHAPRLG
jgi:Fe2+ or Zn2+ uptake regulation protein/O6-methylguanine-DNA--protein-cysteine methyltransferase